MKRKLLLKLSLIILSVVLIFAVVLFVYKSVVRIPEGKLSITDSKNRVISYYDIKNSSLEYNDICFADYTENVILEGCSILSEKYGEYDREKLLNSDITITTYFEDDVFKALKNTFSSIDCSDGKAAEAAIVTPNGRLIASIGVSDKKIVTYPHDLGSAIKPVSVYAPALENGVISWASSIADMPLKNVVKNGVKRGWPANYNGKYLNEKVGIKYAVKHSLNTVAVRVLKKLTPEKSCEFLEKLGIDVSYEKKYAQSSLQSEVYGNLALGDLKIGVTAEKAAAAYQIFANGGNYTEGHAIKEIRSGDRVLYKDEHKSQIVMDSANAKLMTMLLNEVVTAGGTAEEAFIENLNIAGKTGTSNGYKDNWFIGYSPDYICSVWYGYDYERQSREENISVGIFKDIFLQLEHKTADFKADDKVVEKEFCVYTNKLASEGCRNKEVGYFNKNSLPEKCTRHQVVKYE